MWKGSLSPRQWCKVVHKMSVSVMEDPVYGTDPMMEFHPANSGSLNLNRDTIQKRKLFAHSAGCGIEKKDFRILEKKWKEGKYYALTRNGKIAVAHDDVVKQSVGLGADMSLDVYFRLAREVCMRMEHNETLGMGPKKFRHWFQEGYQGGGGSHCSGGAGSQKRSGSSGNGFGGKKARISQSSKSGSGVGGGGSGSTSGGVFDLPDEFSDES